MSKNAAVEPAFGVPIIIRFATLSIPLFAMYHLASKPPLLCATMLTFWLPVSLCILSTMFFNSIACCLVDPHGSSNWNVIGYTLEKLSLCNQVIHEFQIL